MEATQVHTGVYTLTFEHIFFMDFYTLKQFFKKDQFSFPPEVLNKS